MKEESFLIFSSHFEPEEYREARARDTSCKIDQEEDDHWSDFMFVVLLYPVSGSATDETLLFWILFPLNMFMLNV